MKNHRTFCIAQLRIGLVIFLLTNTLGAFGQISCSYETVVNSQTHYIYLIGNYELEQQKRSKEYRCNGVGGYKFSFFRRDEDGYPLVFITQYDDNASKNELFGKKHFIWPLPAEVDSKAIPEWVLQLIKENVDLFRKHLPNLQSVLAKKAQLSADSPKTTGRGARGD